MEIRFIRAPMGPVSLMVIISIRDTSKDTMKEAIGPSKKPPMVMITSFGSYFKNRTTGIRIRLTII